MNPDQLLAKAKALSTQTKNEGLKQFAGSAYDKPVSSNVISANQLRPTQPINLIPPKPALGVMGMNESLATTAMSNKDAYTQSLDTKATTAEKSSNSALDSYLSTLSGQTGQTEAQDKLYSQTVDPVKKELDDINSQILSEQNATRRKLEQLSKNPQGLFGGGLRDEMDRINRESLAKVADLSVIQMGIQGRYDSAKEIADRAVSVQMEKQRNNLEALRVNYEANKDLFNKAEQRAFEANQANRERELNKEENNLKEISDFSMMALEKGVPSSIVLRMRQSKTLDEAIKLGGKYFAVADVDGEIVELPKTTGVITTDIANVISSTGAKPNEQMTSAINVIAGLQQFANRNLEGRFFGLAPVRIAGSLRSGNVKTERQSNIGDVEAINLKLQQWASGASLTDRQTKQVKRLSPDKNDSDLQIKRKINQLANYMVGQVQGQLAGQGINYTPQPIDFFDTDPLELNLGDQDPLGINGI